MINKYWLNKKFSENHKRNISKALKGKKQYIMTDEIKQKISKTKKGTIPWNKDKRGLYKFSENSKRKMSLALKDKNIWSRGRKLTEQHKKNITIGNMGKHHSEETKRKIGRSNSIALKGYKHPEEWKRKRSERWKGNKCHFWKGGITHKNSIIRSSLEYRLWREAIFKKNNYICGMCNKRGCDIEAHHLWKFSEFPELRFSINNGITLCKDCHKKIHKKGGKKQ